MLSCVTVHMRSCCLAFRMCSVTSAQHAILAAANAPTHSFLSPPFAGQKQDDIKAAINKIFLYSYVWAIGGSLVHTVREDFDEFARELLQPVSNVPHHGLIWDYFVDFQTKFPPELKPWTAKVPGFTYNKALPYFQMLVPTVDTVRFAFLMDLSIDVQRSVLFTGASRRITSLYCLA